MKDKQLGNFIGVLKSQRIIVYSIGWELIENDMRVETVTKVYEGEANKCYYPLGNMYVDHICANDNIVEIYIDDTLSKTMAKLYGEKE